MGHREKIFRMFHRTGMTEGEGKGFGLPGVKRIVERHGGWIMVESESGKGSTFLVSLPSVQG